MHVYRVVEGYNEYYEEESGTFLVEHEKISKLDLVRELVQLKGIGASFSARASAESIISKASADEIILATLILDNNNGLSNYATYEHVSVQEAIEQIDGGYGIVHA